MADTASAHQTTTAVEVPLAPPDEARRSDLSSPRVIACLLTALSVSIVATGSIELSRWGGSMVAAFWPSIGLAVTGWLRGPRTRSFDAAYALFLMLAYGLANLMVGNPPAVSLMFTAANMAEAAFAVILVRRFLPRLDLSSLKGFLAFMVIAPVFAPLPSALAVGAMQSHGGSIIPLAETWWFGHMLGLAVVAPFGLGLTPKALAPYRNPARALEAVAILAATVVVSQIVFFQHTRPIGFLVTPVLLIAAMRLRLLGVSAAVLIVSATAVWGVVSGQGPTNIMSTTLIDKVRLIQLYCLLGALPALPVAALLDERDRLAAQARADQARAEAANAGKSRLLANVSHEIKSPVAGIIGIGELWAAGKLGPVSGQQEEMAEMLVRTARQVEALAYDLLDVAHAEAGTVSVKLQPVDLEAVVEDVRRTVSVKPEAAGLKWTVEGRGEGVTAMADSVRLVQIVTNLVTNAVKYGRSGGVVAIKLVRPTAERVRVEVADRGPGIPLAKQPELFEPFNRLGMEKTSVEGHGIGLTLARRLAELMGGHVGFESRPGEGSRFWIELPAAKA
jgi:signal transduction histidine kinase